MSTRFLFSFIGLSLVLAASAGAQGNAAPARPDAAEHDLERSVRSLSEQAAPDGGQARELERAARQLLLRDRLNPGTEPEIERLALQLGAAQGRRGSGARTGGPASLDLRNAPADGPVITGAPFSADVVTTVTQTLADATRIEQRVTGKLFRDSTGRIRREQTVLGLDAVDPAERSRTLITMDAVPGDAMPYVLDPAVRTARRAPRGLEGYFNGDAVLVTRRWLAGTWAQAGGGAVQPPVQEAPTNARELARATDRLAQARTLSTQRDALGLAGGAPIPADIQPTEEQLGQRQVEGVLASGRRSTIIIPTDRIGNDRPIYIVDEAWFSPQLNVIVSSRFSDPRTGVIEYRLTNINRAEPRDDLFTVPADYTVVGGGGGGGRGGRRSGGPAQ